MWDFNVAFGFQNQKKRTKQRFFKIKKRLENKKNVKKRKKRDQNKKKTLNSFYVYDLTNKIWKISLFCSLAILDPRVGHATDVLSAFIPVLHVILTEKYQLSLTEPRDCIAM